MKHSDGLEDVFEAILTVEKNEIDININKLIEKRIKETQGKVRRKPTNRRIASGAFGCHFSPLPFTGVSVTNGRRAIQNMVRNNLLF